METPKFERGIQFTNNESIPRLRELVKGTPDAFFILTGAMRLDPIRGYVSGSFNTVDENSKRATGVAAATGGNDRILAAAAMHDAFPEAVMVAMSVPRDMKPGQPTYARLIADELTHMGVDTDQILLEEHSVDTITEFVEAAKIWKANEWSNVAFVLADFHIPRATALFNHIENFASEEDAPLLSEFVIAIKTGKLKVQFLSTTKVLLTRSKKYEPVFEALDKDPGMRQRIAIEENAVAQIVSGVYGLGENQRQLTKKIQPHATFFGATV